MRKSFISIAICLYIHKRCECIVKKKNIIRKSFSTDTMIERSQGDDGKNNNKESSLMFNLHTKTSQSKYLHFVSMHGNDLGDFFCMISFMPRERTDAIFEYTFFFSNVLRQIFYSSFVVYDVVIKMIFIHRFSLV